MNRYYAITYILIGFCLGLAVNDLRAWAEAGEARRCVDGPDTRAYMSRLPGEPHTVERCVRMIRFGSPSWVPELGHPLKPQRSDQ